MEVGEKTVLLPIEGLPAVVNAEMLDSIISEKEQELNSYKEALKALVWMTEPNKMKPSDVPVLQWIGSNIDNLIGVQNQIGSLEVLLYKLRLWKQYWKKRPVVKGFQSTEQEDEEGGEGVETEVIDGLLEDIEEDELEEGQII